MTTVKKVNVNKIIWDEVYNNKTMLLAPIFFMGAIYLSQVVFSTMFSEFVTNFPDKVPDLDYKKVLIMLSPYFFSEILFYFSDMIDTHNIPFIEKNVIKRTISEVIESSRSTKKELNANEIILNIKKMFEVREIYTYFISYVVPALVSTIALTYYFLMAELKVGIIVILMLLFTFFWLSHITNDCFISVEKNEEKTNEFCDDLHDVLNNIDHVIVAGMEKKEEEKTYKKQGLLSNSFITKDSCNTNLKFSISISVFALTVILSGLGIYTYHIGKIDKAKLIAMIFMVSSLVSYYDSVTWEMQNMTKAVGNYNEISNYFSNFDVIENQTLQDINVPIGNIQFVNINLNYGDKKVYKNLNLKIDGNLKVGIMGEIGSGKSTLLKLLIGLVKYDGTILIDNQDISKYSHLSISKNIGYIPQNPKLFNRTVLENLTYGTDMSEDKLKKILNGYDLLSLFEGLKNGLQTIVGKNGEKLSGGQRQMVYIMRSLIQNKKILLFDEPTSSLDSQHKQQLINIISKIKNKTIIMVTHDDDMLELFDRVLIFDHGKIIKDTK